MTQYGKLADIMQKIAISIALLHTSGRDVLSGIFRHIESSTGWKLTIWQSEENPPTPQKLAKALEAGLDGVIITELISDEFVEALATSDIPVVAIGVRDERLRRRRAPTAFIHNDNTGIGRCGARYLAGLGPFRAFGFVLAGSFSWSESREAAFRRELPKRNVQILTFRGNSPNDSEEGLSELSDWLRKIDKPAAIMAACDWRAVQVLAACEAARLKVPEQVAVLGVDNDEFVCLHAFPPLSSIVPGHEEMGRLAAQTLDHLIQSQNVRKAKSKEVWLVPSRLHVIERESSRILPPATRLVERAKQFIRENAHTGIKVKDVVAHVRVSRRLLELRLREANGETIQGLIEKTRFTLLKRLLTTTSRPIASLAKEAGFQNANTLAHLFKKRTGVSMRQFRTTARQA